MVVVSCCLNGCIGNVISFRLCSLDVLFCSYKICSSANLTGVMLSDIGASFAGCFTRLEKSISTEVVFFSLVCQGFMLLSA